MTVSNLFQQLEQKNSALKELSISKSELPLSIQSLMPKVFGESIQFELISTELELKENQITISGICQTAPLSGMNILLTLTEVRENWTYNLEASKDKEWNMGEQFPPFKYTLVETFNWNQVFLQIDHNSDQLSFSGAMNLTGESKFSMLLPTTAIHLIGNIKREDDLVDFRFENTINIGENNTFLDGVEFTIGIETNKNAEGQSSPIAFVETTPVIEFEGGSIHVPLKALIANLNHSILLRANVGEISAAGIKTLEALFHGHTPDLSSVLDGKITGIENFQIKFLQFSLNPKGNELLSAVEMVCGIVNPIDLFSFDSGRKIAVDVLDIAMRLEHPLDGQKRAWHISAHTDFPINDHSKLILSAFAPEKELVGSISGEDLTISELISYVTGNDNNLDIPIAIQEFHLRANLENNTYGMFCDLVSTVPIEWEGSTFNLQDFRTTIQYESELSIRFKALFSWFDFHFRMEGFYEGGDAGGIGFKGQLIGDNAVNLIFLLHGLARQLEMEAPSDFPSIALRELGISFNTKTGNYRFEAETSFTADHLGDLDVELTADTRVVLDATKKDGKTQVSAEILSKITVAGQIFDLRTHLGKDHQLVYASWQAENDGLKISDLIKAFDQNHDHTAYSSNNFDLELKSITLEYDHTDAAHQKLFVRAITEVSIAGTKYDLQVYFAGWKDGSWKFLFGIEYDNHTSKLGDLVGPNQNAFSAVELIYLKKASVVFSTGNFEGFTLPDIPTFYGEESPNALLLSEHELKIQKGIYAIAEVEFNGSSAGIDRLKKMSNHTGDLIVQAGYNARLEEVTVDILLEGDIVIEGKKNADGKHEDIVLSDAGFHIKLPQPSLFVSGKATFSIDHHQIIAQGGIGITAEEVVGEFKVNLSDPENPDSISFFGLDGLFLDDVMFLLGINFTHSAIEVGGEIGLHEDGKAIDSDQMGIILEIIDGIPNPQFFELRIEEIDFSKIFVLFSGADADGHQEHHDVIKAGIKNFYLFWAQKEIQFLDRTVKPGFAFMGEFFLFDFQAYLNVKIGSEYGIIGEVHLSPIEIDGIIKLKGDGEKVEIEEYENEKGITVKVPESGKENLPDGTETMRRTIVKNGGPVVVLNSNGEPYLHADIEATLLDFLTLNVAANVNKDSFDFDFLLNVANVLIVELHCDLNKNGTFKTFGTFHLGVDLDLSFEFLGSVIGVDIQFGIDVEVALGFVSEEGANAENEKKKPEEKKTEAGAYLYFSFEGNFLGIFIGPFEALLTLNVSKLEEIPGKALESVEQALIGSVDDMFNFVFNHDEFVREKRAEAAARRRSGTKSNHDKYIGDVRKTWEDNKAAQLDNNHKKSSQSKINQIMNDLTKNRINLAKGAKEISQSITNLVESYSVSVTGEVTEILVENDSYLTHFSKHTNFIQTDRFSNEEALQMSKWHHEAESWRSKAHVTEIHAQANVQADFIKNHAKTASAAMKKRAIIHFNNSIPND